MLLRFKNPEELDAYLERAVTLQMMQRWPSVAEYQSRCWNRSLELLGPDCDLITECIIFQPEHSRN